MSRFSPTVQPIPEPSFLAGVADTFRAGLSSYRETQDRVEEKRERDRRRRREDDDDFMRGVGDAGTAEPVTPVGPPQDEDDPLAQAAMNSGVAASGRNPSGVPGAFDPITRSFSAPRIASTRLPSGRMWNPQAVLDREMAARLQQEEATTAAAEAARTGGVARRSGVLGGLAGQDAFKDITPEMARALSETEGLFEEFLTDRLRPRIPVRGTPEYAEMLRAEAEARAEGGAAGRPTTGGGSGTDFSELARQINDAQEELTRVERDKPEPKRTGMAVLDPFGEPLDKAASDRFVADSTAQMKPWEERRAEASRVLEGLRAVRGDTTRAAQGRPRDVTPQRSAEYTRERATIDQRLQRILSNPRATPEIKRRAQAAYSRQLQELNSRYRDR